MPNKPFKLAVRAMIKDEQGRCLLIRRSDVCKHFVGQWEWPGGKVDDGETFDVALLREVHEETGLEVELLNIVGAFGIEMDEVRLAVLCIEARLLGGTLRLSEEHNMHKWVPAEEMLKMNMTNALKPMIERFVKKGAK